MQSRKKRKEQFFLIEELQLMGGQMSKTESHY